MKEGRIVFAFTGTHLKVPAGDIHTSLIVRQLFVMLASVFSVIVYRIAVGLAIYQTDSDFIRRNAKLATSVTAAFINLVLIIMFNFVSVVAVSLCISPRFLFDVSLYSSRFLFDVSSSRFFCSSRI